MAQGYLHGAETTETKLGAQLISVVKSSVIALIGIAPTGPVQTPTLVVGTSTAEQFGAEVPGFNIPEALAAIYAQGAGQVIVINVFDANAHTVAVANETLTIANGRASLAAAPVGVPLVLTTSDTGSVLTLGTDYAVNAYGVVTIKNRSAVGGYPDGTTLRASYRKLDAATVGSANIIGDADAVTGARTGGKALELCFNKFGFNPKILIAPGYSQLPTVAAELLTLAAKYRAIALLDAPKATYVPAVLNGRAGVASIGAFSSTDERAYLLYPHLTRTNPASLTGADKLVPYSALMAGVISYVDYEFGYWYSPSNYPIQGVTGVEVPITASFTDRTAENQQLNAAGVTTVFNGYGTGIKTWGNRSAAFPGSTEPSQFVSVRRTADIIEDSIELAMFKYADKPLNVAVLDAVRQDVNAFLSSLVQRGAIIDGVCVFLAEDNPISQLAAGQAVFQYDFMPPVPLERFTMKARINTEYLKKLVAR